MKILDSDHCVALLRGDLNLRGQVAPTEELAVTSVSVGELVHGVYKSVRPPQNLARLDVLLAGLTVLPYDELAAHQFGLLKASLEREGMRLSDLELQIASIAMQHHAPLITHNQRHFEHMPDLILEDWLA